MEKEKVVLEGRLVAIYGSVADVKFDSRVLPAIYDVILVKTFDGKEVVL